ncbi:MAG: hypothetical protein WD887_00105 [Candidatus Saccharimonadales bacterium]
MTPEATYRLPEVEPSEKEMTAGRVLSKTISQLWQAVDAAGDTGIHVRTVEGLHVTINTALPLASQPVDKNYKELQRVVKLGDRLEFNEANGLGTRVWERIGKSSRRVTQLPGWSGADDRRGAPEERRQNLDEEADTQLRPFTVEAVDKGIRLQGMIYAIWYSPQPHRKAQAMMKPAVDAESLNNLSESDLGILEERADAFQQELKAR